MKHYLTGLLSLLFTSVAPLAFAQPSFAPAPQAAGPSPRIPGGFFLRMSLGPTYGSANDHISGSALGNSVDLKIKGNGAKVGLYLGGTPAPGVVIGGAFVGNTLIDPEIEFEGQTARTSNTALDLSSLDAFLNYYPSPGEPFHLQGSVGFGTASLEVDGDRTDASATGVVFGAGLGGDWSISDFWYAGVFGGARYAHLSSSESGIDERLTIWYPSVEVTFTYY